jgi:hypothetical protein
MIQPLRNIHGGFFILLALLLPVLFVCGIVFRHSWPSAGQHQTMTRQPQHAGARP